MKRFLALLALAALLASPVQARQSALVDLQVLDLDRGELLPRLPHRGHDYIEGRPGHRYALVLQNLTGERLLAVVSVDGVNVVTGETASPQQSGYVLAPWQRLEIRGWRKDLGSVAAFHFTDLPDSYAARTGRPGNVGVLGVAVFRERRMSPPVALAEGEARAARPEAQADAAAPRAARSREAMARQQLGTGHGERLHDHATTTHFERASRWPAQVREIRYDGTEALVARGILPRPWHVAGGEPVAFPGGFVPDP